MNRRGISRRDFVKGRFWRWSAENEKLRKEGMRYPVKSTDVGIKEMPAVGPPPVNRAALIPVLRPPGAVEESAFLDGCTRCNECASACPHDAIRPAPERMRAAAGTPMLVPEVSPCLMCEDYPCIAACEPKVLRADLPKMMGTAVITAHLCVAHHGTQCDTCQNECPVDGAIELKDGKPVVNENQCTGCGVCRYVCPAPENAILLMPTFVRPMPS